MFSGLKSHSKLMIFSLANHQSINNQKWLFINPPVPTNKIHSHYSGVLLHLSNPFNFSTRTPDLRSSRYSRTGLSYASSAFLLADSMFGSTEVVCVDMFSSSSSLCPSSHAKLQQTVALVIRWSNGLRERIHCGRKSQVWSLLGR